jgi:WD40 repeat protein
LRQYANKQVILLLVLMFALDAIAFMRTAARASEPVAPQDAVALTGAAMFAAHDSGEYSGYDYWSTGGPASKLFFKQGETWLNAPDCSINIPLTVGLHTFRFFVEPTYSYNPLGLNLFFDGQTKTPGISAVTTAEKVRGERRPFAAGRGNTMRVDDGPTTGAGTLVYTRNDWVVELIGYRYEDPAVFKQDFVSHQGMLPDGAPDVVGTITLRVTRRQDGELSREDPGVHVRYKAVALAGHQDSVTRSAFSADGKTVLTLSGDGTLKLWTSGGKEEFTLREDQPILDALFSPDGKRILGSLGDGTAVVWATAARSKLFTLKGHTGQISCMAYSSDGKRIVTGSYDATVRVWNAATGREQLILKGHTGTLTSVSFSPDGRTVLSAGQDRTAKLWSLGP